MQMHSMLALALTLTLTLCTTRATATPEASSGEGEGEGCSCCQQHVDQVQGELVAKYHAAIEALLKTIFDHHQSQRAMPTNMEPIVLTFAVSFAALGVSVVGIIAIVCLLKWFSCFPVNHRKKAAVTAVEEMETSKPLPQAPTYFYTQGH